MNTLQVMSTLILFVVASGAIALVRSIAIITLCALTEDVELATKQERQLTPLEKFVLADMLHEIKSGRSRILIAINGLSLVAFLVAILVAIF